MSCDCDSERVVVIAPDTGPDGKSAAKMLYEAGLIDANDVEALAAWLRAPTESAAAAAEAANEAAARVDELVDQLGTDLPALANLADALLPPGATTNFNVPANSALIGDLL